MGYVGLRYTAQEFLKISGSLGIIIFISDFKSSTWMLFRIPTRPPRMLNGNTWALATELTTQQLGDDVNSLLSAKDRGGAWVCVHPPSKLGGGFK